MAHNPRRETRTLRVREDTRGEVMEFDVIADFLVDPSRHSGPAKQAPFLDTCDKDRQIDIAPLIGGSLNMGAKKVGFDEVDVSAQDADRLARAFLDYSIDDSH